MLMTKLKSEEVIGSLTSGKVFIINCHGCKEVGFPEEEAKALQKKLPRALKKCSSRRSWAVRFPAASCPPTLAAW